MEPFTALGFWLLDRLAAREQRRRRVQVRVHRADAFTDGGKVDCYFVNVTNLSPQREIVVTHVWFETTPPVHVLNPQRPLPKRLALDEPWETFAPVAAVPGDPERVLYLARVRLSTRAVIKSRPAKNVPPYGTIPGG